MRHMKHLLTTMAVLLYSLVASAQTKVEIDGIWYNLVSKVKQAEVTSSGGSKYSGSITIPATVTYDGVSYSVTSIGGGAFWGCSSLTAITLPEVVTSIGGSAFRDCLNLTTINIPKGVTSIGSSAFYECSSLTAVYISDIAAWCNIEFPSWDSNPLTYANNLYLNGELVTELIIPEGVTSIGNSAFRGCRSLTSITIPESVTSIGKSAFEDCCSLTTITIPKSVTSIGDLAFCWCSNLTSITIGEGVTSIGGSAFASCSSLTTVTIAENSQLTSIGGFSSCSSLTTINIPESVTSIREWAFNGCSSLTSITLPEGVTSIEDKAFYDCSSLTTIVLPKSVKNIYGEAFANCAELYDVYCYAETVPSTETDAFNGSYPDYATLHVPASAIESYKTTAPWSNFGNILSLDGDQPAEEGWSEWNHLGTAVTASGKESMIATFQYWGTESVVAWDEPITIDQRTNVADPTKHQLRLNDIFNGKEIILDYDSSTGKISAEQQSTGYATNKELMVEQSGWSDFYDEFMFALDYTTGSYNPLTGTIDLSKAFFHVSDPSVQMFYFNLGFTLQIEGVTPPTFTYAWDRTYVGRGECEATLTVTFEEPIVKYRKLVIAPGETVYVYQLEELYKANPETDLEYEDTDQPTTTITCDQIGIYRVLLIPLGADGTAVMDYMLARMVSYAEPDYDSYTWNYIGTSTVIEAMGSNLIPNEEAWEEVDGIWVNKYPWTVEVEGVQTYRRADNPNIIGLRNLYGENHPYSSMFQFIDQSQDWWVYIDVTNPEDVRLLTTPVGATSSNDGYASFISHYAEANAAATYTDGVITFPFFSVLLGNIVNQEQVAEFDFKVILPEEETMPMEAITINQYGSGTYCSEYALDFSNVEGLKAYAATGYNSRTGVVTLTRVMTTQPGEGLFIKGNQGKYVVPIMESTDDHTTNMLVGTLTETAVNAYSTDGLYANYKYTIKEGDSQPLFYQFADGSTLGAGKAYLQIPVAWLPQTSETKSISLRFDEGEGTTDIENSQFTIDNSQLIYDLYGRRVDNPVKGGIYIVGGRKVVY